jgi:hypothetical protein
MRIAQFTSFERLPRADDPVEIQRKQLYWTRLVGVIVAVCFFSFVISQCMHNR